jgi:hypothetical protein
MGIERRAGQRELLPSNIPSEHGLFYPVGHDEGAVPEGEEGGDVGGAPEEEGGESSRGKVPVEEGEVGDGLIGANIGKGPLVGVFKGGELGILGRAGRGKELATAVENAGEVAALLGSDLGA